MITNEDENFVKDEQRAGVDANYYAKQTYDYYKDTFGRESYDNQGSPIVSLTHVNNYGGQDNRNNAAWIGDKRSMVMVMVAHSQVYRVQMT